MKKYLQISENEKNNILKKYSLLLEEPKSTRVKSTACKTGNNSVGAGYDCVVTYTNGDTYEGTLQDGIPTEKGTYTFVYKKYANNWYVGDFTGTISHEKIHFKGNGAEGDIIETEDLLKYHTEDHKNEESPIDGNPNNTTENIIEVTDELRKNWPGCLGSSSMKQYDFSKKGYLTKMPELGWGKFKGVINGKQVTIENACFDKFKVLQGNETGERGKFTGAYYTDDVENDFFKGDETKANTFKYGTLENSDDYYFYDSNWQYNGSFIDGKIDGTSKTNPKNFINVQDYFGEIMFSDGNRYQGDFIDGSITGNGSFIFKNGMRLDGFFTSSKKEGGVISVVLNDGKTIPNIFRYNEKYKGSNETPEGDKSIGAIKGSTFNGITYFKLKLESKKSGKVKEFNDPIPNTFIRLTNVNDKNKVFQTKSNQTGNFEIKGVPFGQYDLYFVYGDEGDGFIFEKEDYQINKETQKVNVTLSPTKSLQKGLNRDVSDFDKSETNEFGRSEISSTGSETDDLLSMSSNELINYLSYLQKSQVDKKLPTVTTEKDCLREFKLYANIIRKIYNKEVDPETLKTSLIDLQPTKKYLQGCIKSFGDKITTDKDVKMVMNPPGVAYDYGIRLENKNKRDIYIKDMRLSNTINKVITEHSENKKRMIQESKILDNKFNFIVENYNLNRRSERRLAFNELREEKSNLIRLGYDKTLVKESFLEVMKNLFGDSGQNPVEDFKKGLSEKLSAPIDLKVLVNEMDTAIIENAFKTETPKEEIMNLLLDKIKEKIEPQVNVVFDNINKKMDDFRSAVGGLQV